jgi:hypothetical protein
MNLGPEVSVHRMGRPEARPSSRDTEKASVFEKETIRLPLDSSSDFSAGSFTCPRNFTSPAPAASPATDPSAGPEPITRSSSGAPSRAIPPATRSSRWAPLTSLSRRPM